MEANKMVSYLVLAVEVVREDFLEEVTLNVDKGKDRSMGRTE